MTEKEHLDRIGIRLGPSREKCAILSFNVLSSVVYIIRSPGSCYYAKSVVERHCAVMSRSDSNVSCIKRC